MMDFQLANVNGHRYGYLILESSPFSSQFIKRCKTRDNWKVDKCNETWESRTLKITLLGPNRVQFHAIIKCQAKGAIWYQSGRRKNTPNTNWFKQKEGIKLVGEITKKCSGWCVLYFDTCTVCNWVTILGSNFAAINHARFGEKWSSFFSERIRVWGWTWAAAVNHSIDSSPTCFIRPMYTLIDRIIGNFLFYHHAFVLFPHASYDWILSLRHRCVLLLIYHLLSFA